MADKKTSPQNSTTPKSAGKTVAPAGGEFSSDASSEKFSKLSGFDNNVLGAIVRIDSGGKIAASWRTIAADMGCDDLEIMHSRKLQADINDSVWFLKRLGLIKLAGNTIHGEDTYEPAPGGEECYLFNRSASDARATKPRKGKKR